jgi:hypothetical protein
MIDHQHGPPIKVKGRTPDKVRPSTTGPAALTFGARSRHHRVRLTLGCASVRIDAVPGGHGCRPERESWCGRWLQPQLVQLAC